MNLSVYVRHVTIYLVQCSARNYVVPSPPNPQAKLTFVGMSGVLLNLIRISDGADWTLAATSALPSRLKFEGQSGVLNQERQQPR